MGVDREKLEVGGGERKEVDSEKLDVGGGERLVFIVVKGWRLVVLA